MQVERVGWLGCRPTRHAGTGALQWAGPGGLGARQGEGASCGAGLPDGTGVRAAPASTSAGPADGKGCHVPLASFRLCDRCSSLKTSHRAGIPTDGYLEGNRNPTPANWEAAFPMQPVDWAALQAPPGNQRAQGRRWSSGVGGATAFEPLLPWRQGQWARLRCMGHRAGRVGLLGTRRGRGVCAAHVEASALSTQAALPKVCRAGHAPRTCAARRSPAPVPLQRTRCRRRGWGTARCWCSWRASTF